MFTIKMLLAKATKNTYVYREEESNNDAKIPSLYIRKSAFGDTIPEKISVAVDDVQ